MRVIVYSIRVDGVPRYYGSGTESRPGRHLNNARNYARLLATGAVAPKRMQAFHFPLIAALLVCEVECVVVAKCTSYAKARKLERKLILKAGIDNLWNVSAAGSGITSPGARRSNNRLATIRRNKTALKAKWADPAYKARMRALHKKRWAAFKKDKVAYAAWQKKVSNAANAQWARGDGWS